MHVQLTELAVTTTWLPLSDFSLKLSIETEFLISYGIICHTFEAKHLIEFSPYWLVQALPLMKFVFDLKFDLNRVCNMLHNIELKDFA